MRDRNRAGWAIALLAHVGCLPMAAAQVVERDTKLTGPKGRTIERSIRTERGPGFVDRRVEIKRPHETLIRDTRIQQPGGHAPPPGPGFRPGSGPPRGPGFRPVVERDVIIERGPVLAPFVAPFLSFSFGSPPPPPPPPVVYVPEPVYVPAEPVYVPAPYVAAVPPVVVAPAPAPEPVPVVGPPIAPQVADAIGRLSSFHHQSRRDGCLTLGHLGDARAVPPLMARLEQDFDREVRTAAAWALGELADPRAALVLERAALYDKRQEVRDAARLAYRKLPRPGQAPAAGEAMTNQPIDPGSSPQPAVVSQPTASRVNRPASVPTDRDAVDPGPPPATSSDVPPPLPVPDLPR